MTPAEFRARRPEFRTVGDSMIQAALDEAVLSIASDQYGLKTARATSLKTADILARSPYGRSQRLVSDEGTTIYSEELEELRGEIKQRMIVI